MAEVQTAEETAKVDAAFLGISDTPPAPVAKVVEAPKVEPAKPDAAAAPAIVPEKPKYIRVPEKEWDNHKAMFGKVATLESTIAKLTGSIPKADALIQQVIKEVQSQTPAGMVVQFDKEHLAEIAEDFPVLAEQLERALNKGKVKGTAPAAAETPKPAAASLDPDAIDKAVEGVLTKREAKQKADALQKETDTFVAAYPNWREIVGAPPTVGADPVQTEWRVWATANDHEATVTDSPAVVQASIAKFNAISKAPATGKPDKAAARRAVMEDAVTPRTDGAPPPLIQPPTAEEAFLSVKRRR